MEYVIGVDIGGTYINDKHSRSRRTVPHNDTSGHPWTVRHKQLIIKGK